MKHTTQRFAGYKRCHLTVDLAPSGSLFAKGLRQAVILLLLLPALALGFEVNSEGDEPDEVPGNGSCAIAGTGLCTLRAAIMEANADASNAPYRITFADSVETIVLDSALPQIIVPIEINGMRADLLNPRVELDGDQRTGGLSFSTSASQGFDPDPAPNAPRAGVFNMVIHNFNASGISLSGSGYTIQNNYIGVLPDGETASPNRNNGITVSGSMPNDPLPAFPDLDDLDLGDIEAVQAALILALAAVQPPVTIDGNLISGNGSDGVRLSGQHTAMVFVRGNRIGTNAAGDAAIPNASVEQGSGVRVLAGGFANIIGPFNLISGNNRANSDASGVDLDTGSVRFPNFVAGNLIGPGDIDPFSFDPSDPGADPFGDLGNVANGIRVRSWRAPANPTPYSAIIGPANLISFNGSSTPPLDDNNATSGAGIMIDGSSEDGYVFGNIIGGLRFEPGGMPVVIGGNRSDGIIITRPDQRIGGTSLAERNTISGNLRHGISMRGGGTRNVLIQGNLIGRDPLNFFNAGNAGDGIHINAASLNTIGGSAAGAANVIAASGRNGIKVTNGGMTQGWANLISRNSLFDNATSGTGIGIDLERTPNAPDPLTPLSLPNSWSNQAQTAPVICAGEPGDLALCAGAGGPVFDSGSNQLTLRAVLHANPNREQVIESFLAEQPGNLNNGEGSEYLDSSTVITDGSGFAVIDMVLSASPGSVAGSVVTLTATDVTETTRPGGSIGPANNSSEFSAAVAVSSPGSIAFDPDILNFGTVQVGASVDLSSTLTHLSGDAVSAITLGVSGDVFSIENTDCPSPPFTLGPGDGCEVTVRFAPLDSGAADGSLSATPGGESPVTATLSGLGQTPGSLVFADSLLDFEEVVLGQSDTLTTSLDNPGDSTINNVELVVSGSGFSRDGGSCPLVGFNLAGGEQCTVTVRYEPLAAGAVLGTLSASGDEDSTSIPLEGTGLNPASLMLDQPGYDFGTVTVGSFVQLVATLNNPGDVPADNVDISVTGSGFSREPGGSCSMAAFELAGGASCSIHLRFEPAAPGIANGDLLASGDGGLSAAAGLLGDAVAAGDLMLDPASLPFGDVVVGQSDSLTTQLENVGGSPITDINISVGGAGFTRDGGSCPLAAFTLDGGENCTVEVSFTPAAAGAANGSLNASGSGALATAPLSGNGLAAASLTLDPDSLPFGDVSLGQFVELNTTLANPGAVSATAIDLLVSGAGFSRVGGDCPMASFDLAGGENCSVTLRFEPAAAGAALGSLQASADGGLSAMASLSGTGLVPASLSLDPDNLPFGNVLVGQFVELSTTLANPGQDSATGVAMIVSGAGFSRAGGDCPMASFDLPGGESCVVVLRFEPAAAGAVLGSLEVSADAGLSAMASLSGSGVEPGNLLLTPGSLPFGDVVIGENASLMTSLSNNGAASVDDIELEISGPGFTREGGDCPLAAFSLDGGENCSVVVRFAPLAAGVVNGSLSASGGGMLAMAPLSGTGLAAASLALDPTSLPFGDVNLGEFAELNTTLSNPGAVSATGVELVISGAGFSRAGGDCPMGSFDLDAGESCSVTLRFEPAAAGATLGSLEANADGGLSAMASLSGAGVASGSLAFSPSALVFGDVDVGQNASLTSTLSNNGLAAVDDIELAISGSGFTRDGGDCPPVAFSLDGGESCTVAVRFAPAAAGAANGSLSATPASAPAATASLSGSGPQASPVQFDPPAGLQFGQLDVGESQVLPLLITNSGSQPLENLSISVEGAFDLLDNPCPATLPAGASCTLQIEFAPGAAGSYSGLVRVLAAGGINVTVGLSGSALGTSDSPVPVPLLGPFGLLILCLAMLVFAARQSDRRQGVRTR